MDKFWKTLIAGAIPALLFALPGSGTALAGSCSAEHGKCRSVCKSNPQFKKCPATCSASKKACLKTGVFHYPRKADVTGLQKR
ncbi:MAG: hypothetical protein Kow0032_22870 [Methyloligellaceae bacterium]